MTKALVSYTPADRIAGFKPYIFVQIGQTISKLISDGVDVIRLDMGSPDLAPPDFIIDKLRSEVKRSDVHSYSPNGGTKEFREGVAAYYQKRFGVTLDPQNEVFTLIGSKEGLFALSQVLLNPGDVSLVPDPGYPVYSAGGSIAGAEIVRFPIIEKNSYLPDLNAIPKDKIKKAKVIWINYPNNPTGAIATQEFYPMLINFAHENNILIAHDAPYADVTFEGYKAPSILQYEGAKEVSVEFNSLSKLYNMAGWRLGMVLGNSQVLKFISTYKSQQDTSHFSPMMTAGQTALISDQSWIDQRNLIYQERRDIVVNSLLSYGMKVNNPRAAIYVWMKIPEGKLNSVDFSSKLLMETGVSTTPGSVYGDYGEGYVRISLCIPADRIKEAMRRFGDWIRKQG